MKTELKLTVTEAEILIKAAQDLQDVLDTCSVGDLTSQGFVEAHRASLESASRKLADYYLNLLRLERLGEPKTNT